MRVILGILVLLVLSINNDVFGQYFYVRPIKPGTKLLYGKTAEKHLFKIMEVGDSTGLGSCTYPILLTHKHYTEQDTILMIEELLKYKGDTRLCVLPIMCYNPLVSQIYMGKQSRYSIQLEALFTINQLYFEKPFMYSAFPVLYDRAEGKYIIVDEKQFSSVYDAYVQWFNKVKAAGIKKARAEGLQPLRGPIRWY